MLLMSGEIGSGPLPIYPNDDTMGHTIENTQLTLRVDL